MTGGAPLARGGTAAGGTEETRGGDIPTTGRVPIGTGATAGSGGMLARPPTPAEERQQSHGHVSAFSDQDPGLRWSFPLPTESLQNPHLGTHVGEHQPVRDPDPLRRGPLAEGRTTQQSLQSSGRTQNQARELTTAFKTNRPKPWQSPQVIYFEN